MFDWVQNRLLASGLGFEILSSYLFPVYKLNWENSQPENMCNIVSEKAKGHGGILNKTSVLQKQPAEGIFKKMLWEISQSSQENIFVRISFLLKSVDLQFI